MEDKTLLFIGGFPSGGTDLVKNILNSHSEIYINGEMPFLHKLYDSGYFADTLLKGLQQQEKFRILAGKLDQWNNLEQNDNPLKNSSKSNSISVQEFLYNSFSIGNQKIWGNKTPQNTENYETLNKMFPNAKYLIVVRDIRDICLSVKKKWGKNMNLTAYKWNIRMGEINKLSRSNPNICIVKYEDILFDLEGITKKIANFLCIKWESEMLQFHTKVENKIDGKINYGEKLITTNFNKWKKQLNNIKLKKIEGYAYSTLKDFSYDLTYAKKQIHLSNLKRFYYYGTELISMIFVGNTNHSKNSLMDRFKKIAFEIKKRIS